MSEPKTAVRGAGPTVEADVVVVGAGPAGSATAAYLADRGLDVALLEKATFPREKVCGDGLTPRAIKQLIRLGIDTVDRGRLAAQQGPAGLRRTHRAVRAALARAGRVPAVRSRPRPGGLRRAAGRQRGRRRRHAARAGQRDRADHRRPRPTGSSGSPPRTDGRSAPRSWSPPTGTRPGSPWRWAWRSATTGRWASRCAPTTPARGTNDDYLESWLELWDGKPRQSDLLPGYGWIFGMGDGTGATSASACSTHRSALRRRPTTATCSRAGWTTPRRSGVSAPRTRSVRSWARRCRWASTASPHYTRGLLLVGDAGGMVVPFNGEGIAYAMEAGRDGGRRDRGRPFPRGRHPLARNGRCAATRPS